MNIVDVNIEQINVLCRKYAVNKLFVFGSVLTDRYTIASDIDFLVDFKNIDVIQYADNYFGLKFSLEEIFHKEVDLLEQNALKNPYLKKSIDSTKQLIYGRID